MLGTGEKLGLVLAGGGAKAAYQAGVLRGLFEICKFKKSPFQIISGISAGALNGVLLATQSDNFDDATRLLWDTWASIRFQDVAKIDALTLLRIGTHWIKDLSIGGWSTHRKNTYLLDNSPLSDLIKSKIQLKNMQALFSSGLLHGVAVSTTDYLSGRSVTFFEGDPTIDNWSRTSREGRRCVLDFSHILASAAIPIFFPPVLIDNRYYGDGGIVFSTPLSPVIHMGANRIFALGIRDSSTTSFLDTPKKPIDITLGEIAGTLLNSLFLDMLDADFERLQRINRTQSLLENQKIQSDHLKVIPALMINPSRNLGGLASQEFQNFPATLRHLLKGLGVTDEKGWDLLSYLAFESEYTRKLLELGHSDAYSKKSEILAFFGLISKDDAVFKSAG